MVVFNIQRSYGSKRSVRYYKQPNEPSTIAQGGCAVCCSVEYSDIKAAGVMIASNSCTCTEFGIGWVLTAPMNTIPGNQYFTKTALKHEFNPAVRH
ncbi:hypothetical protein DPMN_163061 [Dreissena polymorpha]|uniref:Uncharacterized protein n=1 Tax=Dreissena polymorpha TaxID=45954 RepID=A0A9D4IUV3_DREPO|nr:hypothetical protein DPMN_163061 [Dreissena polymorpha]